MNLTKMFKGLGLLAAAACIPMVSSAQFSQGDNVLGVGVGVLGGYGVGVSGSGVRSSPAINFHFDHGMGELGPGTWGLGGYVGYKSVAYDYYTWNYNFNVLVIGARGTWHYNEWHGDSKWDTYGGAMLAYRSVNYTDNINRDLGGPVTNPSFSRSGIDLGLYLGARYYFTDKIGAYGEFGYGLTTLQLGLAVKL